MKHQPNLEYYDTRLTEISALKQKLFDLMSDLRNVSSCNQFEYQDACITIEQEFNDLLTDDWHTAKEISRNLDMEFPKSRFLISWEKSREAETNGEQYLDILNKDTAISVKGE